MSVVGLGCRNSQETLGSRVLSLQRRRVGPMRSEATLDLSVRLRLLRYTLPTPTNYSVQSTVLHPAFGSGVDAVSAATTTESTPPADLYFECGVDCRHIVTHAVVHILVYYT